MRTMFVTLTALGTTLLLNLGLAQTTSSGFWLGGSLGAPGINLHVGADDLLGENVDLRGNVGYSYLFSPGVYVGADALFDINLDTGTAPVDTYLGAGAFASFGSNFGLGFTGLFGGEYRLAEAGLPEGGLFLELGPDLYLAPVTRIGFTGRFGFNYHF